MFKFIKEFFSKLFKKDKKLLAESNEIYNIDDLFSVGKKSDKIKFEELELYDDEKDTIDINYNAQIDSDITTKNESVEEYEDVSNNDIYDYILNMIRSSDSYDEYKKILIENEQTKKELDSVLNN